MSASTFCMTIKLRSDMCCGTGEANGVSVDQLTALDARGLPVIPAKRIKGLLREQAELIELPQQHGLTEALFGAMGNDAPGKLSFSEAHLVGHELLEARIDRDGLTPGTVAAVYTIARTTTSVAEDGVADDHTLRTTQLVRRCDTAGEATEFECSIRGEGLTGDEKTFFANAVKCLRAVGQKKSRGLGEVVCGGSWKDDAAEGIGKESVPAQGAATDVIRMGYRIALDGPAVVQGGDGRSLDYISGSVVQGVFASRFCKDEDMLRHVLNDTRFGNAYINIEGGASSSLTGGSAPVPLTYKAAKNDLGGHDAGTDVTLFKLFNLAKEAKGGNDGSGDEAVQQVALDGYGSVVDGTYCVTTVRQSMSFHSSSPSSPQGKQYYSYLSIDAGQSFSGIIEAPREAMGEFCKAFGPDGKRVRVGAAGGSGFGDCRLSMHRVPELPKVVLAKGDRVAIQMLSDVVYVDKSGANSLDVVSFVEELSTSGKLGFEFATCMNGSSTDGVGACKAYVKTCVAGGFNAHWRLPKRQYGAFQKGSVVVATVTKCDADAVAPLAWTGLLQEEGFGLLAIQKVGDELASGEYAKGVPAAAQARNDANAQGCGDEGSARREEKARSSFEHDLRYNEACDEASLQACRLGDGYPLGSAAKSAFMRIASVYGSARKQAGAGGLRQEFLSLARDSFVDDATLLRQCEMLASEGMGLQDRYPSLRVACHDVVFEKLVQGYLHQVKVRYSTTKGGSDE